jgi:hypothetical protein
MNAVEALKAARVAGVRIAVDGDHLLLKASTPPSDAVVDLLARHKAEVMALLHRTADRSSSQDYQARCIVDGLLEPAAAAPERAAVTEISVVAWLNQHADSSAPGSCTWCGRHETSAAVVLPFGVEPGPHTWLHPECWAPWHQARRELAMVALSRPGGTP